MNQIDLLGTRTPLVAAGWEYTFIGAGEPILVLHGGHSNCQERFGYEVLLQAGYSILTPSRPGYGATPIETGKTPLEAARSLSGLLRYLELTQVHVLGISGGGPTALSFASLFPERVKSLILESAVSKRWLTPQDKTYKRAKLLFAPGRERFVWSGIKFLMNLAPKAVAEGMLAQLSKRHFNSYRKEVTNDDLGRVRQMILRSSSGQGFMLDLEHETEEQTLRAITCPVLILHCRDDGQVSFSHATYAKDKIKNATLVPIPAWGHLIWLGKGEQVVNEAVISFLQHTK
jgi:pimeloyl-ACP methyl ester carboxylesterase